MPLETTHPDTGTNRGSDDEQPAEELYVFPLSTAQATWYFLKELAGGRSVWDPTFAYRVLGSLDIAALRRGFHEIVRRHEILRTTFPRLDGAPVQAISPSMDVHVEELSLRHLPPGEREQRAREVAAAEDVRPFDLGRGPLFRVTLLELDAADHVLIVSADHIVFEAWALLLLVRELELLYRAYAKGEPSPLPALPIQYADYADWQQERRESTGHGEELAYWTRRLAGLPRLQIPFARRRAPERYTYRGQMCQVDLGASISGRVRDLAQRERASVFIVLLGALKALVCRETGQADVLVASLFIDREQPELSQLIGVFVNLVMLRTDLSGDPSFLEIVRRVRDTSMEAQRFRSVPLGDIVARLDPRHPADGSPPFQIFFQYVNLNAMHQIVDGGEGPQRRLEASPGGRGEAPVAEDLAPTLRLPGALVQNFPLPRSTARTDLEFHLSDGPEGISGVLFYSAELFEAPDIAAFVGRFRSLIDALVASPDAPLSSLPLP